VSAASLKRFFIRNSFRPGIFGLFINPFYFARKGLYRHIKELCPNISGRVLDVGCGSQPYRDLIVCDEYVGLEIESPQNSEYKSADVFYDGTRIPFPAERFDSVLLNQVLEHVFEPDTFLREICRVLKPGGALLLTVPFVWDEHEQPYDYARYSSFGIRDLLTKSGFQIIEQRKSVADARVLFQLLNCYLHKRVSRWPSYSKAAAWMVFSPIVNLSGEVFGTLLPPNPDLYLDNIVLARKAQLDS
jgi:SAM-dependent methyltransferase